MLTFLLAGIFWIPATIFVRHLLIKRGLKDDLDAQLDRVADALAKED